jgi:hypothetical protein
MQRAKDEPDKGEQLNAKVKFGERYENTRKLSKFDAGEDLVVVPVEIEIDSMLYNLIQSDIVSHYDAGHAISFEEWVNICFKERMEQIISDPKEFVHTERLFQNTTLIPNEISYEQAAPILYVLGFFFYQADGTFIY